MVRRGGRIIALFVALAGATLPVSASRQSAQTVEAQKPVDVTKLGPQVGEKVPDFTLPDQGGELRTLQSLAGPKGLVLVFSRSADW